MARTEVFKLDVKDDEFLHRLIILNGSQYDVVTLFDKGHTHAMMARELNIPIGTVKSRLSRARDRIVKWRAETELKKTL